MSKIYISPSMQEYNKYAAGNTTEAKQCHKIGEALYAALKRCGISAKLAPASQSAEKNVSESNSWNADYHICIHTNAANGKARDVVVFATSKNLKDPCVVNVYNEIDKIDNHKSIYGIREANYYEMKYTNAKCIYIECEFHDNVELAKWIIEHTTDIGEAIARGMCKGLGVKYVPAENEEGEETMERWQTLNDIPEGAYRDAVKNLMDRGIVKGKFDGSLDLTEDMVRTMIYCMRIMGYEG